jgi:hypothetical protein
MQAKDGFSGSHISDEADLRSVAFGTSADVDEEIADELPSGGHSASNVKNISELSGTVLCLLSYLLFMFIDI